MIKVGKSIRAYILACALISVTLVSTNTEQVSADATFTNKVVISSIQSGDLLSLSNEYVQITNNSALDITISGWCINYASGTSVGNGSHLACFAPSDDFHQVILPAYATATAASNTYRASYPNSFADLYFNAGISASAGHIILIDQQNTVVDKVGWGNAVAPESSPLPSLTAMQVAQRVLDATDSQIYQDTNNNGNDFITKEALPIILPYGMIYEQRDACTNLPGMQVYAPEGYTENEDGTCVGNSPDSDTDHSQDESLEPIENGQGGTDVSPSVSRLQITEIFPNPTGVDDGNEFIELFNPTHTPVNLADYRLVIGSKGDASLSLSGLSIEAHAYLVIKNDVYHFALTNTRGKVVLMHADTGIISQTDEYTKAPDGKSWADIDSVWQYTAPPTPGQPNTPNSTSFASVGPKEQGATLTPCPTGQYRHPETNRCRKITSDQGSTLVPCKANQERNPETNRCRNVAAASQKQLTPCKEGQERNPDTNRCRNVVSSQPPEADYAVLGASTGSSSNSYVLWVVLAVLSLGIAYIIWEWHVELGTFLKRQWRRVKEGKG